MEGGGCLPSFREGPVSPASGTPSGGPSPPQSVFLPVGLETTDKKINIRFQIFVTCVYLSGSALCVYFKGVCVF